MKAKKCIELVKEIHLMDGELRNDSYIAEYISSWINSQQESRMPSDEVSKGLAIYNELKGITKVELLLEDNGFMTISEYMHSKFSKWCG